jgi:recombination protein RecT
VSTAIETTVFTPAIRAKFQDLLPTGLKDDHVRLIELAVRACHDEKLKGCSYDSMIESVTQSAQLGIPCDGVHGALVPYGGKCQFQAMYPGLIDCARRTGEINRVNAQLVYECDTFDIDLGSAPKLTHKPDYKGDRTLGNCTGAYAVAEWADGGTEFEFMTRDEILAIKANVKAKNGPWFQNGEVAEGQMWKKTPLRRLMKRLPMSVELLSYLRKEDEAIAGATFVEHEDVKTEPVTDMKQLAAQQTARQVEEREAALEGAVEDFFGSQDGKPAERKGNLPDYVFGIPIDPELTWETVAAVKLQGSSPQLGGKTFGQVRKDLGLMPLLKPVADRAVELSGRNKDVHPQILYAAITLCLMQEDEEQS